MNPSSTQPVPFADIEDLIQSRAQRGSRLMVAFACPVSGTEASVTVDIVKANGGSFATKAKTEIRGSAAKSISRSLSRTLRGLLGNNVVSKLVGEFANDRVEAVADAGGYTDDELEKAIVEAFERVRSQFVWVAEDGRYVHRKAAAKS